MKAGVMQEVGVIRAEDVPEPQVDPDRIKVKIAYCGICGSDVEVLEGRFQGGRAPAPEFSATRHPGPLSKSAAISRATKRDSG